MSYKERYEQWLNDEFFDEATRKELEAITDEKKSRIASIAILSSARADCAV